MLGNDVDPEGATLAIDGVGSPLHGSASIEAGRVRYTPNANFHGTDGFTYTITDPSGLSSTPATVTITVTAVNDAPVAIDDNGIGFTTTEDTSFTTANALANDNDVDHPLDPTSIAIDTTGATGSVTNNLDGTFTYIPAANWSGVETFTYTITDPSGLSSTPATVTITVTAVNDAPVASNDGGIGFTTTEDTGFATGDVTLNDSDNDDAIDPTSIAIDATVTTGSVTNNLDGTFTYTPTINFNGSDTFTYTITDAAGATSNPATVTITVTPVNDAPVTINDNGVGFTINEDSSFTTANALANDADIDDPIDPASILIDTTGTTGAVINNLDGTFTYTPTINFNGSDTFTYTITDAAGATSNAATVTITVTAVNDAPVTINDNGIGFTTNEDTSFTTANALANDNDVDHPLDPGSVAIDTTGTVGNVTNNLDGTFTYTPTINFNGSDTFTYTITDAAGATSAPATITITVTAVNDAPVAIDDNGIGFTTNEDTPLTTPDVTLNDSDPEDATIDHATLTIVTNPANGAVVYNGDGTFTYTPDADSFNDDSFGYRFTDSGSLPSNEATVSIVVDPVNDAPRPTDDVLSVDLGSSATTVDVRLNDVEPEGDVLTVTAVTDGADGTVTNNGDGTLTYSHNGSANLSDSFTYTVEDPQGAPTVANVLVTVVIPEDGDGVPFASDNCPKDFNPLQNDTDGDGIGDVCDASPTQPSSLYRAVTFQNLGGEKSLEVASGDLNGDGDIDLVFANADAFNTVWFGNAAPGDATFANSGQSLDAGETTSVALGDFDGDGDLDIVFANDTATGNTVWFNDGSGVFTDSGQSLGNRNTQHVDIGDFDGDGDLDLVFANFGSGADVWFNNGSGVFSNSGQSLAPGAGSSAGVADIDADGDLDLVLLRDGQDDTIWFNDGSGTFTPTGQTLAIVRSHDVAFADLDADGDVDFVIAGDNDFDSVWLNNGGGAFTKTAQTLGLGHSRGVSLGDLDGDGDVDIAFGDHLDKDTIWENDGTGSFTLGNTSVFTVKSEGITLADVDGNGTLDVIYAVDGVGNTVRIS